MAKTMTINDLLADLKSRINPAYAHQLGTESYERRLCVEAMEQQAEEIKRLRDEIADIKQAISDPENQPSQYGTILMANYDPSKEK